MKDNVLIVSENELSEEESALLMKIGACAIPSDKVRRIMKLKWPQREYRKDLLSRMMKKAKTLAYGSDKGNPSCLT